MTCYAMRALKESELFNEEKATSLARPKKQIGSYSAPVWANIAPKTPV